MQNWIVLKNRGTKLNKKLKQMNKLKTTTTIVM